MPPPDRRLLLDTRRATPSLATYLANRRPSELAPLRGVLESEVAL